MTDQSVDILLVEDNPDDVLLTMHSFQHANFANTVHIARDGAEALEYIFCTGRYTTRSIDDRPKVVLLDLKLPLVDGLEVLRRMKADPRTAQLPVVVLTSSREERDIVESYGLGVNSYIVKPVDFEQFAAAVSTIGMYWLLLNQQPAVAAAARTATARAGASAT